MFIVSLFLELCGFFPYLDIRTIPTNSCIYMIQPGLSQLHRGLAARVQTKFFIFFRKNKIILTLAQVHATFFEEIFVFLRKILSKLFHFLETYAGKIASRRGNFLKQF
jgi:hypothetical protein